MPGSAVAHGCIQSRLRVVHGCKLGIARARARLRRAQLRDQFVDLLGVAGDACAQTDKLLACLPLFAHCRVERLFGGGELFQQLLRPRFHLVLRQRRGRIQRCRLRGKLGVHALQAV